MPKPKIIVLDKESYNLKPKNGGGQVSTCVMGYKDNDGNDVVTKYSMAYINHLIYTGDNGRVLGFDNSHGFHHRHYMGAMEPVDFISHEATVERFEQELKDILKLHGGS